MKKITIHQYVKRFNWPSYSTVFRLVSKHPEIIIDRGGLGTRGRKPVVFDLPKFKQLLASHFKLPLEEVEHKIKQPNTPVIRSTNTKHLQFDRSEINRLLSPSIEARLTHLESYVTTTTITEWAIIILLSVLMALHLIYRI